jgi:hypothetical protein
MNYLLKLSGKSESCENLLYVSQGVNELIPVLSVFLDRSVTVTVTVTVTEPLKSFPSKVVLHLGAKMKI